MSSGLSENQRWALGWSIFIILAFAFVAGMGAAFHFLLLISVPLTIILTLLSAANLATWLPGVYGAVKCLFEGGRDFQRFLLPALIFTAVFPFVAGSILIIFSSAAVVPILVGILVCLPLFVNLVMLAHLVLYNASDRYSDFFKRNYSSARLDPLKYFRDKYAQILIAVLCAAIYGIPMGLLHVFSLGAVIGVSVTFGVMTLLGFVISWKMATQVERTYGINLSALFFPAMAATALVVLLYGTGIVTSPWLLVGLGVGALLLPMSLGLATYFAQTSQTIMAVVIGAGLAGLLAGFGLVSTVPAIVIAFTVTAALCLLATILPTNHRRIESENYNHLLTFLGNIGFSVVAGVAVAVTCFLVHAFAPVVCIAIGVGVLGLSFAVTGIESLMAVYKARDMVKELPSAKLPATIGGSDHKTTCVHHKYKRLNNDQNISEDSDQEPPKAENDKVTLQTSFQNQSKGPVGSATRDDKSKNTAHRAGLQ